MARYTYQLLIPFLSESTQNLIEMPADDWLQVVEKYISLDNWPQSMGGHMANYVHAGVDVSAIFCEFSFNNNFFYIFAEKTAHSRKILCRLSVVVG
jgi:hypothetical protein